MSGKPIMLPQRHAINIGLGILLVVLIAVFIGNESKAVFWLIVLLSFALGGLLIIPIGGADMPVVVSMLNSYSGWAAAGIGFTLGNLALIITGALVGSSGAILSYIMCKAMNRSFVSVILGGFGGDTAAAGGGQVETRPVKQGSADDAAYIMKNAERVIIVPGYGMAVAQAQHSLREMVDILKKEGVEVKYAIHPVAGRMPGHMNVLLAEAKRPLRRGARVGGHQRRLPAGGRGLRDRRQRRHQPRRQDRQASPIYGMPILDVEKAKTVLFIKRGMGSGYAGVENEVFFRDNTMMLFGDAKKVRRQHRQEPLTSGGFRTRRRRGRRASAGPFCVSATALGSHAAMIAPVSAAHALDAPRAFLDVSRSVLGRPWRDRCADAAAEADAVTMVQAHALPDLLARVLAGRGVRPAQARRT